MKDFASSKSRSNRENAEPRSATDDPAAADDTASQTSQTLESLEALQLTQSGADAELERAFFSRGLSHEALTAAGDHQEENEPWHHTERAGRRRLIGIAVSGALVLVAVAVGVRGLFADRVAKFIAAGSSEVASAPLASVKRAPARAPTPESVNAMPLELVPPVSSEPRLVSVAQLRARLAEGPAPESGPATEQPQQLNQPEPPRPTERPIVAAPEKPQEEPQETPRTATSDGTQTKAVPAVAAESATTPPTPTPVSATPTATQPVTQINGSTRAPAMDACNGVLRSGRFRDIDTKCRVAFEAQPAAGLAAEVAQAALEHGRNADAATWARRAISADPKLANAFVLLGGAEQQLGHPAEARAAYARYLELAPDGEHARDVRALLPSLAGM